MSGWRKWAAWGLVALLIFLILVSFLPLWWTDRWWVRLWDFPRLQVAGLLLIGGIAILFLLKRTRAFWALIAAITAALLWQGSHFLAYFPPYPEQVESAEHCPPGRQISVLNANVLMSNKQYEELLRLVKERQPDVLLLLEPGFDWAKAVEPLRTTYPYQLSETLPNTYGMILMSRLPIQGRIEHLLQPGVPSAHMHLRLRDGEQVNLHALHPEPPYPGDDSGERDAELVMVGRYVRDMGRATIVMGDLNDVGWSRTSRLFRKVAGMADPRVGRGFYPTYNANYPLLRWPLDHLFVSPHFELMQIDLLPDIGSDHLPIYFRLCLKEDASARKVAPAASPSTEAEASQELGEGFDERREENRAR
ncbi:MAG: endonuclease/exonuclease/phosphatase family protein [Pseudomonadota bacterium]|nr:endonuclease/exonuclease/phosphatase family protein [Pseudomonadota bacterium]